MAVNNAVSVNMRRLMMFVISLLVCLFLYVFYIQIITGDSLTNHPLNKRTDILATRIERGAILSADGARLAYSKKREDGTWQRDYPLGSAAAHVTGYTSSKYGLSGMEELYNIQLSGLANPGRKLGPASKWLTNSAGATVILTIDSNLQMAVWKALGNRRGAAVVIDPQTGAILAMISRPSFQPADIDTDWQTVTANPASPLLNRVTQGLYPPGSIIKPLVAEAALQERITTAARTFQCDGQLKVGRDYVLHESNDQVHGKVDLQKALAVSCNVTFGQLALQMGRSKLFNAYDKYGFSRSTSTELADAPGRLPDFDRLNDGDLVQMGIGQSSLLVTPLKMVLLAAAIGNKGIIMKPHIMQQIQDSDGRILQKQTADVWLTPISPTSAATLTKMMVAVIDEGTGSQAAINGIKVAGKTGTAENPHGADHSWFIGFAPAEEPKVAVAVIVENAGSGGLVATPIARHILTAALNKGR